MIKNILLSSVALLTGVFSSPISNSDLPTQEIKTRNRVNTNLRSENSVEVDSECNIENNNVSYDLKYYFGTKALGDDYKDYDLNNLIPKPSETKDDNFKFLLAKPFNSNCYLYTWSYDVYNYDFVRGSIIYSTSTKTDENGNYIESWEMSPIRFINSCGSYSRFAKWSIDGIFGAKDTYRIIVNDIGLFTKDGDKEYNIRPSNKGSGTLPIGDEFTFSPSDNTDISASYFKDDYVKVTDHQVSCLLTQKEDATIQFGYVTSNAQKGFIEDFYYFFNLDRNVDELVEIQYDYSYGHYEVWKESIFNAGGGEVSTANFPEVYYGLFKDSGLSSDKFILDKQIYGQRISKGSTIGSVKGSYALWWKKDNTYRLENIQDCTKVEQECQGNEYQGFRQFINNNSINGTKYKWAFHIDSFERDVRSQTRDIPWYEWIGRFFTGTIPEWTITTCHEVKQAMVTWLHYRSKVDDLGTMQDFYVDVLDTPCDTTTIEIQNVHIQTLAEDINTFFVNLWDNLGTLFKNIWGTLLPILIVVAVIILFVVLYPLFSKISQFFSDRKTRRTEKKYRKSLENQTKNDERRNL